MTYKNIPYPYFVEYIENGERCSDHWSEETLNQELNRGEVQIVNITLSWKIQEVLGVKL